MNKTKTIPTKTLSVYAIRDDIAGVYTLPILQPNNTIMSRYFQSMINSKQSATSTPTDFKLYKIGEYDDSTASIIAYKEIEFIENGELVIPKNKNE
ncbi:MAG: hypothetical protein KFW07_00950 [Mycoplasmataceae bacterium]|nr:hypothetical protein [Mycoplasmataceae bacterium]